MQLLQCSALMVVIMISFAVHATARAHLGSRCIQPSNLALIFTSLNNLTETSRTPGSHCGFQTCPQDVSYNPDDPVCERSICPWYYSVIKYDDTYYPQQLTEARCRCRNCVGNNINTCEPVSINIHILERTGCKNGVFTYQPRTVPLAVACTCTKGRLSIA